MRSLIICFSFFILSFINTIKAQYKGTDLANIIIAIELSKKEAERQNNLLVGQTANTVLENTNKEEWTKFNKVTGKIQVRLSFISTILKNFYKSKDFIEDIKQIRNNQKDILKEINNSPEHIKAFLPEHIGFEKELNKTYKLAIGIVADQIGGKLIEDLGEKLSKKINDLELLEIIGEIASEATRLTTSVANGITNMESADRQMLVDTVIKKVKDLRIQSSQILYMIKTFKMVKSAEEYRFHYVNDDRKIMEKVMYEYKDKF